MVLQAFIDDSVTPNGAFVLAGYIATAEVWARFSKEWEERLPYGTRAKDDGFHFKMSEMALLPERMKRVGAFFRIIDSYDLFPISCKINIAELRSASSRICVGTQAIDWDRLADPFFFTFRATLELLHAKRHQSPMLPQNERIDFIFDTNSQKEAIISGWNEFLALRSDRERSLYGETPRFVNDRDFLPLQAADLWAWWCREWHEEGSPLIKTASDEDAMLVDGLPSSKKTGNSIIHLTYKEEDLVKNFLGLAKIIYPGAAVYDRGGR
jgi:Protein of unknown function (DUF3800)